MKKISCDKDLKKISDDCKKMGHNIRIRDISYVYLSQVFDDERIVYKTLFGVNSSDEDADKYKKKASTKFLSSYIKSNYLKDEEEDAKVDKGKKKKAVTDDGIESISFEENRRAIEDDIRTIDKILVDGEGTLDVKEIASLTKLKLEARKTLNDKFGAGEKNDVQYVQVLQKFNHVCEETKKECWLQTKEYAMEHWNLVERKD